MYYTKMSDVPEMVCCAKSLDNKEVGCADHKWAEQSEEATLQSKPLKRLSDGQAP